VDDSNRTQSRRTEKEDDVVFGNNLSIKSCQVDRRAAGTAFYMQARISNPRVVLFLSGNLCSRHGAEPYFKMFQPVSRRAWCKGFTGMAGLGRLVCRRQYTDEDADALCTRNVRRGPRS